MKKLILLSILLIGIASMAQVPKEKTLVDLSTLDGPTTVYEKPGRRLPADALVRQIKFKNLDCNTVEIEVGISMDKTSASWPATVGGWDMPIVLDSTATRTDGELKFAPHAINGVREWNFTITVPNWNTYYVHYYIDPKTCTEGTITVIH